MPVAGEAGSAAGGSGAGPRAGLEPDPPRGRELPGRAQGWGTEGEPGLAGRLGGGGAATGQDPAVFRSGQARSRETSDVGGGAGRHRPVCPRTPLIPKPLGDFTSRQPQPPARVRATWAWEVGGRLGALGQVTDASGPPTFPSVTGAVTDPVSVPPPKKKPNLQRYQGIRPSGNNRIIRVASPRWGGCPYKNTPERPVPSAI